jgi:hypothetical protein
MNNDPSLILNFGDDLERHFGKRILNTVPSYATIWATYVGNDGKQNSFPMRGADAAAHKRREIFWQYLYTLFESLALSWEIEEQFKKRGQINNQGDYAQNMNSWIAFYAHLGRIHDMAERITVQLNQETLFAPFDPFYESRHIALHGIKVPMCWVENVLCAPNLGEEKRQWHTKMTWKELDKDDFVFLSEQVCQTLAELEKVVEGFCSQVYKLLAPRLGFQSVSWPEPDKSKTSDVREIPFEATQSCTMMGNSGVQNISGFRGDSDNLE